MDTTTTEVGYQFKLYQLTNFLIGLIETGLFLRFILRLLGANPSSGFVAFVYTATRPLMQPFIAVLGPVEVVPGGVIEWSILVAIVAYAILGYILNNIINMTLPPKVIIEDTQDDDLDMV